ncbi:MAG: hypothetical protein ACREX9_23380 [Gammaproteobacteria bacterium]
MGLVPMAHAVDKKPNILILWGDDVGYWNISAYNQGMMGYKTPNIDRLAEEGAIRRTIPGHLQGVPAAPEGQQLFARPGAGSLHSAPKGGN